MYMMDMLYFPIKTKWLEPHFAGRMFGMSSTKIPHNLILIGQKAFLPHGIHVFDCML
jgi:hypothetical protein